MKKRSSIRVSHAGPPPLGTREPASYAQQRSPAALAASPATFSPGGSRLPVACPSGVAGPNLFARSMNSGSRPSSRQSHAPPALGHRRSHSNASAASASSRRNSRQAGTSASFETEHLNGEGTGMSEASPRLDAEARQLAARKRAAERQADARIDSFNAHLLAMIRQGREALGTTVEVDADAQGAWLDEDE